MGKNKKKNAPLDDRHHRKNKSIEMKYEMITRRKRGKVGRKKNAVIGQVAPVGPDRHWKRFKASPASGTHPLAFLRGG